LRVTDNGPGLTGDKSAPNGTGVGLKNTRARLQQLYGGEQQLELKNAERGGCIVEIALPFHLVETPDTRFEVEYEDSHADR
jgi:two-component system, LytTR family, sensor kinase